MTKPNEIFSDVIKKWRSADSQRMIFGINMPQTQGAIEELLEVLEKVFYIYPTFLLVQKDHVMEVVIKNDVPGEKAPSLTHIPVNLPSLPKIFVGLMINSITISKGITFTELKEFFTALSAKVEEIEEQGGLKGFLEKHDVSHIKVDQMKFQLLTDDEHVTTNPASAGGKSKGAKGAKNQSEVSSSKLHNSVWKDYLAGELDKGDFKNEYQEIIDTASADPKQLEKILKRIVPKQKEAEMFLAQLEQKLFDIGFPDAAVENLKKKLLKPKKVLVSEDELARLKIIEKEFEKNLDNRIDVELKTIKVIKKKLADETERSEAILHQMSQGGMTLDKNGKILSINATAQNVLGISEDDVRGKDINDVLKSHHLLTTVSGWQNETDTHTPKEVKVKALNDETLAIVRESAIVIEDENGRSIGVVSALQNVTQQEELERRKNDILDVLGHDLRAPLGAIKQNFEVLVKSANFNIDANSPQKKFLDNCQKNITRMSGLIEKILDMRQLETGKILLKYGTIEINNLLEEAVNSLSSWAESKKIQVKVIAENMPDIEADPERLYQVITNLVSNALKFTSDGGSIITTGKLVMIDGIQNIEISVQDSGIGIKKEDLTKIFDKYAQVSRESPKGVRGLGLGLSICSTIVKLHGGKIWVDSEFEKGSTFTFQIPVSPMEVNKK